MNSINPGLSLKNHFQENGRFEPFSYTIGLEASIAESLAAIQDYPILSPITDQKVSQFIRSLTFYHEATHLCQFISTAYGLRTLRYTLITFKDLTRQKGWKMPIASELAKRLPELNDNEMKAFEGFLNFIDVTDQLRLHNYSIPVNGEGSTALVVEFFPWSPHFFYGEHPDTESRIKYAESLVKIGAHVRKIPRLIFSTATREFQIIINAALLMEGFAIVVEMNHIQNALKLSGHEVFEFLPPGNEYHVLISYMLDSGLCTWYNLIPTLSVCIDAALMYDPFILYNVPWDKVDAEGRGDQYPGETFLILCEALKKTTPIATFEPADLTAFYKELCSKAGLPDPDWMAQKTFEVAENLLSKVPDGGSVMGKAIKAHYDALKFRANKSCGEFIADLPTSNGIFDLLELSRTAISYYNLSTRQADHFDSRNIDLITIHSILHQALTEPGIECPLKMGQPFFCANASTPSNTLCTWKHEFGNNECWVDILEKEFQLIPS